MKRGMMIIAALVATGVVNAAPILWNIIDDATPVNATVADFAAAGVAGDLTGATVDNVLGIGATNSPMTGGGISLTILGANGGANGPYANANTTSSPILQNYLYFSSGNERAMQISGLSSKLDANTDYKLYLWGVGDNAGQGSKFIYDGITITVSQADPDVLVDGNLPPATDYLAEYTFTTGASVSDTLDFEWHRAPKAAFNGFAIVAIPEPATIGLIGMVSIGLLAARRFRI